MLSCREVVDNADLLIAGDMSWRRQLAIRIHLLMCQHCRRYVRQFKILIRAIPFMHSRASDEEVSRVMACIHASEQ